MQIANPTDTELMDVQRLRLGAELIAVQSVLIRILANLAAANGNFCRAITVGFDEAADVLEQRAAGCRESAPRKLELEALRIMEELRHASLGKSKPRSAV
jgi:hypothetical protein